MPVAYNERTRRAAVCSVNPRLHIHHADHHSRRTRCEPACTMPPTASGRAMGGWLADRGLHRPASQAEPATGSGRPHRHAPGRPHPGRAGPEPVFHRRSVAGENTRASFQPLRKLGTLRQPYRQRGVRRAGYGAARAQRRVVHLVPERPRRLRGRRADHRRHLRHATGQAACRPYGGLPRHQPASRDARHPGRARRIIFLGAEHGAPCSSTGHIVGAGSVHPGNRNANGRPVPIGPAVGRVPQSDPWPRSRRKSRRRPTTSPMRGSA